MFRDVWTATVALLAEDGGPPAPDWPVERTRRFVQWDYAPSHDALIDLDLHILLALIERACGTGELACWLGIDMQTVRLRLKRLQVLCLVKQRAPPLWTCTALGKQTGEGTLRRPMSA